MRVLTGPAKAFLVWCADDYTELFVLRDVLRRDALPASPEDERARGLAALEELVLSGLVRVGDMDTAVQGLRYWGGSPTGIMARLGGAWNAASPPEMGHGPWFHATEAGKEVAG